VSRPPAEARPRDLWAQLLLYRPRVVLALWPQRSCDLFWSTGLSVVTLLTLGVLFVAGIVDIPISAASVAVSLVMMTVLDRRARCDGCEMCRTCGPEQVEPERVRRTCLVETASRRSRFVSYWEGIQAVELPDRRAGPHESRGATR